MGEYQSGSKQHHNLVDLIKDDFYGDDNMEMNDQEYTASWSETTTIIGNATVDIFNGSNATKFRPIYSHFGSRSQEMAPLGKSNKMLTSTCTNSSAREMQMNYSPDREDVMGVNDNDEVVMGDGIHIQRNPILAEIRRANTKLDNDIYRDNHHSTPITKIFDYDIVWLLL